MEKTDHQREMERIGRDQADAQRDAAQAQREAVYAQRETTMQQARQADAAEEAAMHAARQADTAERHAEFIQNTMKLEVADDEEKLQFYTQYQGWELTDAISSYRKKIAIQMVESLADQQIIRDLEESGKRASALNDARQELTLKTAAVKTAEENLKSKTGIYYATLGGAALLILIAASKLLDFSHSDNVIIWTLFAGGFGAYAFQHHKKWTTTGRKELEKLIEEAKHEMNTADSQRKTVEDFLRKQLTTLNLIWTTTLESQLRDAHLRLHDPMIERRLTFEHIARVERDFPATCRTSFAAEALRDRNHGTWIISDEARSRSWNGAFANIVKDYIVEKFSLEEWRYEFLPPSPE